MPRKLANETHLMSFFRRSPSKGELFNLNYSLNSWRWNFLYHIFIASIIRLPDEQLLQVNRYGLSGTFLQTKLEAGSFKGEHLVLYPLQNERGKVTDDDTSTGSLEARTALENHGLQFECTSLMAGHDHRVFA